MPGSLFPTTRGSVVAALASADEAERTRAFDTLTRIYWKPLYKYARIAHSRSAIDTEDLTQAFLATAFERNAFAAYDAGKASFRTFVRTLFDRHIANDERSAARLKRGGDVNHVEMTAAEEELARDHAGTPEDIFQREWIRSTFTLAIDRLRASIDPVAFALLEAYDLSDNRAVTYRELAHHFGLNETAVTNRLATARRALRQTVLDLLREITASEVEFRAEARALLGVEL